MLLLCAHCTPQGRTLPHTATHCHTTIAPTSLTQLPPLSLPQLYADAEKQQKMAKRKDYYAILGLDQTASTRDIKSVSCVLGLRRG